MSDADSLTMISATRTSSLWKWFIGDSVWDSFEELPGGLLVLILNMIASDNDVNRVESAASTAIALNFFL